MIGLGCTSRLSRGFPGKAVRRAGRLLRLAMVVVEAASCLVRTPPGRAKPATRPGPFRLPLPVVGDHGGGGSACERAGGGQSGGQSASPAPARRRGGGAGLERHQASWAESTVGANRFRVGSDDPVTEGAPDGQWRAAVGGEDVAGSRNWTCAMN